MTMINQRVKLKKETSHTNRTKRSGRLGTITGESYNKTVWWVKWDGNKSIVAVKKSLVNIVSNVGDIVNSIFVHKLKQQ